MVFSRGTPGYSPRAASANLFIETTSKCITEKVTEVKPLRSYFKTSLHRYHEDSKASIFVQFLL